MRKIEEKMLQALDDNDQLKLNNTIVACWPTGRKCVYLHYSLIIDINCNDRIVELSSCGYLTQTTKSRINAVLRHLEIGRLYQRNYCWYIELKNGDRLDFYEGIELDY